MLELSTALSAPSTYLNTPITLLRARATTLAFSLLPSNAGRGDGEQKTSEEDDEVEEEREADPDVLPTILAYKDGELERNWIRVDWEIGEGSLESLLRRYVHLHDSVTRRDLADEDFSEGILPREGFDDRVPR